MLQQLRTATLMLLCLTVLTGGLYPLAVTAIAQIVFPHAARGSFIERPVPPAKTAASGELNVDRYDWSKMARSRASCIGSELIGQPFTQPKYFWGRLSATAPVPYNAAASGGSNFGPLHPGLKDAAEARIAALMKDHPSEAKIPVDLVTASGSGLDPHISPAAAEFQVPRIAAARNFKQVLIRELIQRHMEGRQFGVLGEPRVNVLRLNLELDRLQSAE